MSGFTRGKSLKTVFLLFSSVGLTFAVSPDPRLLPLVPVGAQIVAGMSAPTSHDQPGSLLLLTNNNLVDLKDFFALSGVDSSRIIHQVIFVSGSNAGNLACLFGKAATVQDWLSVWSDWSDDDALVRSSD